MRACILIEVERKTCQVVTDMRNFAQDKQRRIFRIQ